MLLWHFPHIYSVATAISTSSLGDHIAISGCRLFNQSIWKTFLSSLWSKSYTMRVQLEQYRSQRDHEILAVQKSSHVFDVTPNNFRHRAMFREDRSNRYQDTAI